MGERELFKVFTLWSILKVISTSYKLAQCTIRNANESQLVNVLLHNVL